MAKTNWNKWRTMGKDTISGRKSPYYHKNFTNKVENQKYVDGDSWKCSVSPTGAHYWIVVTESMTCKYCDEIRQIGEMNCYPL